MMASHARMSDCNLNHTNYSTPHTTHSIHHTAHKPVCKSFTLEPVLLKGCCWLYRGSIADSRGLLESVLAKDLLKDSLKFSLKFVLDSFLERRRCNL